MPMELHKSTKTDRHTHIFIICIYLHTLYGCVWSSNYVCMPKGMYGTVFCNGETWQENGMDKLHYIPKVERILQRWKPVRKELMWGAEKTTCLPAEKFKRGFPAGKLSWWVTATPAGGGLPLGLPHATGWEGAHRPGSHTLETRGKALCSGRNSLSPTVSLWTLSKHCAGWRNVHGVLVQDHQGGQRHRFDDELQETAKWPKHNSCDLF